MKAVGLRYNPQYFCQIPVDLASIPPHQDAICQYGQWHIRRFSKFLQWYSPQAEDALSRTVVKTLHMDIYARLSNP